MVVRAAELDPLRRHLLGFYVFLYVPVLGSGIEHLVIHFLDHWTARHENGFFVMIAALLWILLLALPLSLFLGLWFVAGGVLAPTLILLKLFGTLRH
jgi:hypothetical protein